MNYIKALADYFPEIEAYATGDATVFANLVFTKGSVTQAELDAAYLTGYKQEKIEWLNLQAHLSIIGGFNSDALGVAYRYDSEPEDQLNLVGATALNSDLPYRCADLDGSNKQYRMHTAQQMKLLLADAVALKSGILQTVAAKRQQVTDATTEAEVDAVVWDWVEPAL